MNDFRDRVHLHLREMAHERNFRLNEQRLIEYARRFNLPASFWHRGK
jgi:hypothetical protein